MSGGRYRRKGNRREAGAAANRQLDIFVAGMGTPLFGLRVKLDRLIDCNQPCCRNICGIGSGKAPYDGELICADCGQHRGWLSKTTTDWIKDVVARFGAPTTPIVVRRFHTYEEEVPAAETAT
jgi:hypothetical protein